MFRCDLFFLFFFFFSFISFIADGPHHYHPACGHKGSSHLSPVHALQFFLSRCKFSTLTTRQPMVEFYLLTFPRFPLRKKEHKSYFGKNRTHDFRTSRCAAYLLDHSGDNIGCKDKIPMVVTLPGRSPPLYCVCVCVFSSHSFWTSSSLDVPAGVIHLLSAVRALIFLARRIQPFLSLVDREVEFCVLTI